MNPLHYPLICLVISLLSSFSLPSYAFDHSAIYLKPGEQRVFPLEPNARFSISGSAIRHYVLPGNRGLFIKAVGIGAGTLIFTQGDQVLTRSIQVESRQPSVYPGTLLRALGWLEKTEVIDSGLKFVLRGEVDQLNEARRIASVRADFPKWIEDQTRISADLFEASRSKILEVLKNHPHLELVESEGELLVRGWIESEFKLKALSKQIREILPLADLEIQTLKGQTATLYFKVYLLEVKKEYSSKLGMELTQPLMGILDTRLWLPRFGEGIPLSLEALSHQGWLKVLSTPELVVKSPGQAELFAGGEIPIRLRNRMEDRISWKNVGLSLKLDVKEFNGESVRLDIETELNHLNGAYSNQQLPGIKTNRIKTQVQGKLGKPLFLSGLLQEDYREKISGIPGISEIPVLGKLFGSEDFQNERSELVAILVPYRAPPENPQQRISELIPKGFLPLPHHSINFEALEKIKASKDYPWNAL